MKNKFCIVLSFVFLILCISCNQKVEIEYYQTGEIHRIEKRLNDHETKVSIYFKNGQLVLEGIVRDSLREGQWNLYYSDGVLRGELIYSKDKMVAENIRYPITLDFRDNPSEFKVGNTYQLRILGVGVFFSTRTRESLGFRKIPVDDNSDVQYWFEITPQRAWNDTISVIITGFEKDINPDSIDINDSISLYMKIIDKDTIFFPIKIVEGCGVNGIR